VFLPILLAVLVAEAIMALINVGISAYLTGRWTETGRINAVKDALAKVVEQETAKAFAQEQGKQAAMIKNLEHLDKQMANSNDDSRGDQGQDLERGTGQAMEAELKTRSIYEVDRRWTTLYITLRRSAISGRARQDGRGRYSSAEGY